MIPGWQVQVRDSRDAEPTTQETSWCRQLSELAVKIGNHRSVLVALDDETSPFENYKMACWKINIIIYLQRVVFSIVIFLGDVFVESESELPFVHQKKG